MLLAVAQVPVLLHLICPWALRVDFLERLPPVHPGLHQNGSYFVVAAAYCTVLQAPPAWALSTDQVMLASSWHTFD